MPRDRNGTFESQLVKKRERRLAGFDDRILALYTRHAENALTDFDEKWRRRYPSDEAAVKLLYLCATSRSAGAAPSAPGRRTSAKFASFFPCRVPKPLQA